MGSVDWGLSSVIIALISGLWFTLLFVSNVFELRESDYREQDQNPSFPATVFTRIVYSSSVVMSILLIWGA
jgi:hypothetical protein